MKNTVFITGGSGYIGSLLVKHFVERDDVEKVISLDKKDEPALLLNLDKNLREKIIFIKANILNDDWQEKVYEHNPSIVVHCAWQIRSLYKKEKDQWLENIFGSDNVFDFAFYTKSVKKLIHFSTVASYGAQKDNEISKVFREEDSLRNTDFRYAYEKTEAEKILYAKYCTMGKDRRDLQVFVVRPASITGEYGRDQSKFGLQSVLSGKSKNIFHKFISKILFFAPLTKKWSRQFIHEKDVVGIVDNLAFFENKKENSSYEVFNICPPGDVMTAPDMAKAINKKLIFINPQIIRSIFFAMWHITRGIIPTSRGGWKSYCYPIVVDGSKITKVCGYQYKYGPKESFLKTLE